MRCDINLARFLFPLLVTSLLLTLTVAVSSWDEIKKEDHVWKQVEIDINQDVQTANCYTELGKSFIGQKVRLSSAVKDSDKACIIQLPLNANIQFNEIQFSSRHTLVRVLVGDNRQRLSAAYVGIHKYSSKDLYGDYATPCLNAFMVIRNGEMYDSVTFTITSMEQKTYENSHVLCKNQFHPKMIANPAS